MNGDQKNISALNAGAAYVFVRSLGRLGPAGLPQGLQYRHRGLTSAIPWRYPGTRWWSGPLLRTSSATGVNGNQGDNSAPDAGAAYVFVRTGAVWSQQAYLKASNTGAGDHFGYSVAIFGDTVVVGAPYEASSATGVNGDQEGQFGSLVPGRPTSSFVTEPIGPSRPTSRPPIPTRLTTLACRSPFIGDTVVVGAPFEDSSATGIDGDQTDNSAINAGAVYVFVRSGTNWSQQAYLKASDTTTNSFLGQALSISGESVLCGAPGVANETGAAYVFIRTGAAWNQQGLLAASNGEAGDWFGQSVALSGDKAVIGAPREASAATGNNGDPNDNTAIDAGAAYRLSAIRRHLESDPLPEGLQYRCRGLFRLVGGPVR